MAFTNSQGRTQTSLADPNVTPLVDVVLVLLIIFMVTAPVLQSGIEVAENLYRVAKPVPSVLTLNTVPEPVMTSAPPE